MSDEPRAGRMSLPRLASVVLDLLGWTLLVMSVRKVAYNAYLPLSAYDDGILLTGSMLVSRGEIPYRDFYTNYGPGIYYCLAAVWKLLGVSALTARALGCLLQLTIAAFSGVLAGRIGGRRFSALAAGLVAVWLSNLLPSPFAWLAALALALAATWSLCLAVEKPSRVRWAISGFLLGTTSWYRPDLAVYLVVTLLATGAAAAVRRASPLEHRSHGVGGWASASLLGFLAASLPVWGAVFWWSGALPVHDVLLDQLRIRPARILPAPPLLPLLRAEAMPLPLPAFLAEAHPGAFVLGCVGPLLAASMVAAGRRAGLLPSRSGPALVGALAIAVLPQMMGRSDLLHCVCAVAPSIVLLAACAHTLVRRGPLSCLAASVLVGCVFLPARDLKPAVPGFLRVSTRDFACYGGIPEKDPNVLLAARFLDEQTHPDEPVFVGLSDHRRTLASHLLLNFVAGRRGGTRYMQFDPNLTNRDDVQASMIRDLESRRVSWVVLYSGWTDYAEPNESTRLGSTLLDAYIGEKYEPVTRFGPFEVRRRAQASP